jgi:hypothetical protein
VREWETRTNEGEFFAVSGGGFVVGCSPEKVDKDLVNNQIGNCEKENKNLFLVNFFSFLIRKNIVICTCCKNNYDKPKIFFELENRFKVRHTISMFLILNHFSKLKSGIENDFYGLVNFFSSRKSHQRIGAAANENL